MAQRAGVITVSDGCSRGEREDVSGNILAAGLRGAGYEVTGPVIVPDEHDIIASTMRMFCSQDYPLVISTGGTGFAPRDITPEATRTVIDREAPGIAELLRWKGYQKFERAILSRGVCGLAHRTLIINLPGSPGGVRDGLELLLNLIPHACAILRDEPVDHSPVVQKSTQPLGEDNPPERIDVIETNIDDMSPELYELLMERLFANGALDVYMTPIIMKKQRPGVLLTVLTAPDKRLTLTKLIFRETSSFGVRYSSRNRTVLNRRWETVSTEYGAIRLKIGSLEGSDTTCSPEYEDIKAAAKVHAVPAKLVYMAAARAWGIAPSSPQGTNTPREVGRTE